MLFTIFLTYFTNIIPPVFPLYQSPGVPHVTPVAVSVCVEKPLRATFVVSIVLY